MRAELAKLVSEGRTEQQIVDYYIAKYGSQEPLASPIDRGFNRLAWAFPYLLGAGGLVLVGTVAVKWSRRKPGADSPDAAAAPASAEDAALEARLDDELRDLD
jgi:cytochrome c-type biogenesis protein CcmH/NrfF